MMVLGEEKKVLKVKSGGEVYRLDLDYLKEMHCLELKGLNENSARSLTEVFFRDRDYLMKWLKGQRRLRVILKEEG